MSDDYTIYAPPGYGRIRFGRTETLHISVAVAALTLAFAIVLSPLATIELQVSEDLGFAYSLAISFVIVITGFLLHELAHKFTAQRYGAWAEFRVYLFGLILAVAFAFLGFVFAAPGAVYIQGNITRKQNGMISLSGPLTNLVFGAVFLGLWLVIPSTTTVSFILRWIGTINLLLAAFNLIPFPPLDGSKVVRWNVGIYLLVLVASIILLLIGMGFVSF